MSPGTTAPAAARFKLHPLGSVQRVLSPTNTEASVLLTVNSGCRLPHAAGIAAGCSSFVAAPLLRTDCPRGCPRSTAMASRCVTPSSTAHAYP